MASSDNVLRGGLTSKHVDVEELLAVLDFTPTSAERTVPVEDAAGERRFECPVEEFELAFRRPRSCRRVILPSE